MADECENYIEVPEGHTSERPDGLWRRSGDRWECLSLIDWSWHLADDEAVYAPEPEDMARFQQVSADRAAELAGDRQRWVTYWAKHYAEPRPGEQPRTVLRRRRSPEIVLDEAFGRGDVWVPTSSIVEGFQRRGADAPYLVELTAEEADRTIQEIRGVSGATAWWTSRRGTDHEPDACLDAAEDATVRAVWERAAAMRAESDQTASTLRDRMVSHGAVLAGAEPGQPHVANSLKGLDSLRRQVAVNALEDDVEVAEVLARIDDLHRYTVAFPPHRYTDATMACHEALRSAGYLRVMVVNTWPDPVYKGITTVWRHERSGQRFELQFHTPDSLRVKIENRELYEMCRSGGLTKAEADAVNWLQHDRYQHCRQVNDG